MDLLPRRAVAPVNLQLLFSFKSKSKHISNCHRSLHCMKALLCMIMSLVCHWNGSSGKAVHKYESQFNWRAWRWIGSQAAWNTYEDYNGFPITTQRDSKADGLLTENLFQARCMAMSSFCALLPVSASNPLRKLGVREII